MSKKDRRKDKAAGEEAAGTMSIDTILGHLADLKDLAASLQTPRDDPEPTQSRVSACEAVASILSALHDEGITDPEGVRDLVHDYNALAEQYRKMHQQYEEPEKPERLGTVYTCPKCHRQSRPGNNHCWNCGKRLNWGR